MGFNTKIILTKLAAKSGFTRNMGLLIGGSAAGQVVALASSPILTRLYTPVDFGTFAVIASLLSILSVVGSLRFELAIPLPERDEDSIHLVLLCLLVAAMMSTVVGIGLWFMSDRICAWSGTPAIRRYLWLVPIGIFSFSVYNALSYWAIRKRYFPVVARTKATQAVAMSVVQLAMGIGRFGALGLIIGQLVARSAGSLALARTLPKVGNFKLRPLWHLSKRYVKFPAVSSLSGALNAAGLYLPAFLIASLYGHTEAGYFALIQRTYLGVLSMVEQSIAQAYFAEAAACKHDHSDKFLRLFSSQTKSLLILGTVPISLACLLAPFLFNLVFGPQWRTAGVYSLAFAPMFLTGFVTAPLSSTITILERQEIMVAWDATRMFLVVGVFALADWVSLKPLQTMILFSIAMSIGYILLFLIAWWTIKSNRRINGNDCLS